MTTQFRGRFEIKIDAKGRLSLPPAIRDALPSSSPAGSPANKHPQIVVTNSRYQNQSCLHAYSLAEWENLERKINKMSSLKADVQAFQRFYLSGGQVLDVDAQGRVNIPQSLRKYAGLEGATVLVGLGNKFEIWSHANWQVIYDQLTDNFEETLQSVANLDEDKE